MLWKKYTACVMTCLLLCGCGISRNPTQQALDFRTDLMEAGGCTYTAQIEADLGQRVYRFTVSCDYTAGEGAVIEVMQPQEIAGITARISDQDKILEFDGAALEFGSIAGGNISAMEAGWILSKCWTGAYIASAGADEEQHRITYLDGYGDGELSVDTWLNSSGVPVYGEISYDGLRCLKIELSEFQMKQ